MTTSKINYCLRTLFTFTFLFASASSFAQIFGSNAYIIGSFVEIGLNGTYGHEGVSTVTTPNPAGSHFRSDTEYFGYVANPQQDGWTNFDGDFFTPGTPENGWGFEVGTGGAAGHNNCYVDGAAFAGAITSWTHVGDCYSADWEGDATTGTNLHFKVNYFLKETDLFYTTTVSVTNNTAVNIPEMFYYRNLDPDNNVTLSGDYTTTNMIVSQPTGSGGCNLAHVSATQTTPANSYLGLAGVGDQFRVTYRGFSNRDASEIWNGGITSNGDNYEQIAGSSEFSDQAMSLAYKIENLAPGETETFRFVVILDDAAATSAINDLVYLTYPGSTGNLSGGCSAELDSTSTACNGGAVPLTVAGSTANDYTWSWSPAAGLNTTTGVSVVADPTVTTTYIATGTPLNSCLSPVTVPIYVEVGDSVLPVPTISPVSPQCVSAAPFNLTADEPDGVWTGTGITNGTNGTFNPATAGVGTHQIIYELVGLCGNSDTISIQVNAGLTVNGGPDQEICIGEPVTLSATGGISQTWNNSVTNNVPFNPTTTLTYTVTGTDATGCTGTDQVIVTVNPLPPVSAGADVAVCFGDSVQLNGSGAVSYTWNNGITNGVTFLPITGSVTYTVSGTDANGCVNTDQVVVTAYALPIPAFIGTPSIMTNLNPVVLFSNTSTGAVSYVWEFGDETGNSTAEDPTHTFNITHFGAYEVLLIATSAEGCIDSVVQVIQITEEVIYYIPNAFTPDGDEYNNTFQPVFTSGFDPFNFKMTIYNRWGELIFETNDATKGWDGTYAGKLVQTGIYNWKITFKNPDVDERTELVGSVNILR